MSNEPIRMFASVKIGKADDDTWSVVVNGEEMAQQILAGGLAVNFHDSDEEHPPTVTMTLITEDIEIDLPESEVAVLVESGESA